MKKAFIRISAGNIVVIAFIYLFAILPGGTKEAVLSMGIILLVMCLANIVLGFILLFDKRSRPYGLSMLLFAAISLLCSFTLCSIQPLRL